MSENLWSARELADHYGISEQTVYKRRTYHPDLLPPAVKLGNRLRWVPAQVNEWDREQASQGVRN